MTTPSETTSKETWIKARQALLAKEKELTQLNDELAAQRRALPRLRITKNYLFDTSQGKRTLAELFDGKSQLLVYHFMFGPDWETGCKVCSFWADHFSGMVPHLAARDVRFICASRAPLAKIEDFARRMGWQYPWVSSLDSDFNFDFDVSFRPESQQEQTYNYKPKTSGAEELPGLSAFLKDEQGQVFHTYSCFARGLEPFNATYRLLDLTPKGRDEEGLPYTMSWVRLHDEYAETEPHLSHDQPNQ